MKSKDKMIITKILRYIDEIKIFINGYSYKEWYRMIKGTRK